MRIFTPSRCNTVECADRDRNRPDGHPADDFLPLVGSAEQLYSGCSAAVERHGIEPCTTFYPRGVFKRWLTKYAPKASKARPRNMKPLRHSSDTTSDTWHRQKLCYTRSTQPRLVDKELLVTPVLPPKRARSRDCKPRVFFLA